MGIKAYFDVSWYGPVLDANNKPTKEVKGKTEPPLTDSNCANLMPQPDRETC